MFDLFQQEFALFLASCISERNESLPLFEYIITRINHERSWKVLFDSASISISYSCKKIKTTDILCSHALKLFEANDIKVVPEKYILKRWTREGRSGIMHDFREREVEKDPRLSSTKRYRHLASKLIRVTSDVSPSKEYCQLVDESIDVVFKKIKELRLQAQSTNKNKNGVAALVINDDTQPKGFKQRPSTKRHNQKHLKSWLELQLKKKTKTITRCQSRSQTSKVCVCV